MAFAGALMTGALASRHAPLFEGALLFLNELETQGFALALGANAEIILAAVVFVVRAFVVASAAARAVH